MKPAGRSISGIMVESSCEAISIEPLSAVSVQRLVAGTLKSAQDVVAEEVPIALEYNGISHVVMMATPANLQDFAVGFSLTEGIIDSTRDIYDCEVMPVENGVRVALDISSRCFARLKERRRNLTGRTGCGLCGVDSLAQVRRALPPVQGITKISGASVQVALDNLSEFQPIFKETGATHGAFWVTEGGSIACAREDVGRHNAIDKLIGALAQSGCDFATGAVLITSRASFEIVQKAAAVGIGLVAAVSAPTSLAIKVAEELNVSLIGFVRAKEYVVNASSRGVC
jgi:FdhD protein